MPAKCADVGLTFGSTRVSSMWRCTEAGSKSVHCSRNCSRGSGSRGSQELVMAVDSFGSTVEASSLV